MPNQRIVESVGHAEATRSATPLRNPREVGEAKERSEYGVWFQVRVCRLEKRAKEVAKSLWGVRSWGQRL